MKKYVVYIGWFDDLNFNYVYPEKKEFDNKLDADEYAKHCVKSGFNVMTKEVEI